MKAPLCKICNHNHWLSEPHIGLPDLPGTKKKAGKAAAKKPKGKT